MSAATPTTPLSTIDHLVLMDLLGAPHPLVRSYFPDTAWLFDTLISAETRLRDAGILDAAALGRSFFHSRAAGNSFYGYMGDDHLPFLHRGVSVLHVIAEPFPRVWHTLGVSIPFPSQIWIRLCPLVASCALSLTWLFGWYRVQDDATALDLPTLRAWNLIFRVFFAEYLGLRPVPSPKRGELSSPTHESLPVRKSDSELVRSFPPSFFSRASGVPDSSFVQ